jgi:hypothetical protein
MIATGPFFDDWGKAVARGVAEPDGKPTDETVEVFECLKSGWDRQPKSLGYARAMRAMQELHPELSEEGLKRTQEYRKVKETSQERFEKRWSDVALELMEDIPSRA